MKKFDNYRNILKILNETLKMLSDIKMQILARQNKNIMRT